MSKEKDRLLEYLLVISSQIDDAYNRDDTKWAKLLEDLRSDIYKEISAIKETEDD